MTTKLNITTLRKIRKELEERAQRCRYNGDNFDGNKVATALNTQYAKQIAAIGKIPMGQLFSVFFGGGYRNTLSFTEIPDEKFPAKVRDLKKKLNEAYAAAEERHNEASEQYRLTKLAERVSSIEVECLLGSLTTEDPSVLALLDEIRVALAR